VSRPVAPVAKARCRPSPLAAELRISLMRAVRRLRAEKDDQDLSDAQYSVLALLERRGRLTPRELAEFERVRPPSMTRTLAALDRLGLVTRTGDASDRRQVLVEVTDAGRATVRATRQRRDAWLTRRLAALTPAEREILAQAGTILRSIADS
jgi:DNA-binding MarR family transcriptional regulator